jgi:hypothetical protein
MLLKFLWVELIDHQRNYQLYKVDSVQVRTTEEAEARIRKCAIRHCSNERSAFAVRDGAMITLAGYYEPSVCALSSSQAAWGMGRFLKLDKLPGYSTFPFFLK